MSQSVFTNPIVSAGPTLVGVGNGTLSVDRLTHFTITQDYTLTCIAESPDTLFAVSGSLDGAIGIATVGTQFFDEDLKIFLTIQQGSTVFEVGDQFTLSVENGTDLNQANIDEYDEEPQKNFGVGTLGLAQGDHNLRYSNTALAAYLYAQGLKLTADSAGSGGDAITFQLLDFIPAVAASVVIQDLTYTADTPGSAGNGITIEYVGDGLAGAETVGVIGLAITVHIESTVSTATQIKAAVDGSAPAAALVNVVISGTGSNTQVAVGPTNLEDGEDDIGLAGFELVTVVGNDITVNMESGVSTALQIKTALDGSAPAAALISVEVISDNAEPQFAMPAAFNLQGGRNKNFAFNHNEQTDSGNFAEGNANVRAKDLDVSGSAKFQGQLHAQAPVSLDDQEADNLSGLSVPNIQQWVNRLIQDHKILLKTADNTEVQWSQPDFSFDADLEIHFTDVDFYNFIDASESPISIADGESLYVILDRTQTKQVTPFVATTVSRLINAYRIASRIGDELILADNTLIRDGKSVGIGEGSGTGSIAPVNFVDVTSTTLPSSTGAAGLMFFASFTVDEDADFAGGSDDGTLFNGANTGSGLLNLTTSSDRAQYAGIGNANFTSTGTIRFKVKPGYSGSPADFQLFYDASHNGNFFAAPSPENWINVSHTAAGQLYLGLSNSGAVGQHDATIGAWSPTSGQTYEFELNIDTSSIVRLFIDGVLFYSTAVSYTRDTDTQVISIGNYSFAPTGFTPNFSIDELVIFNTVQHTAGYTAPSAAPSISYSPDGVAVVTDDLVLFKSLTNPAEDDRIYKATVSGSSITWELQVLGQDPTGAPTDGDGVFVLEGTTRADQLWFYSGTDWFSYPSGLKVPTTGASAISVTPSEIDAQLQLDMTTHKIVNVVDPTSPQDAATKAYVDAASGGASFDAIAGENLTAGDALYISIGAGDGGRTAGRVYKLDPTNDLQYLFIGTASTTVSTAATVSVKVGGQVTGLTGLTVGQIVWASVTTPGGYQLLAPTTKGQWVVPVGVADSSATMIVDNIGAIAAFKLSHHKTEDINYVLNSTFEDGVAGYSLYADAAGPSPVDGTGGSPAGVTFAQSLTSPLRNLASANLAKDAADRQGTGVSYDFTIDAADQARVLDISFDYLVASGTFVAGSSTVDSDVTIWIYDVTNAVLIQPSSIKLFSNSTTIADRFRASFQTASNSTSYRLIFHIGSTSALAYTLKFDNIQVRPSNYVYGTPITDWIDWTPTGSFTTNTTYTGKRRQVGDEEEFQVRLAFAGAPNSTTLSVNLPVTIDTAKLLSTTGAVNSLGFGNMLDTGTTELPLEVRFGGATSVTVYAHNASGTFAVEANVTQANPITIASGDAIDLYFRVPVLGRSSSVQVSDSADTRVYATKITQSSAQSITNGGGNTKVTFEVATHDTHGAADLANDQINILVAGFYQVIGQVTLASGASESRLAGLLRKNGTTTIAVMTSRGNAVGNDSVGVSSVVYLVAGDFIDLMINNETGVTCDTVPTESNTFLSVHKLTGPSAIAATESVAARYNTGAGTLSGAVNDLRYTNKLDDSHGAYDTTTGVYTVRAAGRYSITASLMVDGTYVLGNATELYINLNGTDIVGGSVRAGGAVGTQQADLGIHDLVLKTGDLVKIRSLAQGTTPTFNANPIYTSFSIVRTGL